MVWFTENSPIRKLIRQTSRQPAGAMFGHMCVSWKSRKVDYLCPCPRRNVCFLVGVATLQDQAQYLVFASILV